MSTKSTIAILAILFMFYGCVYSEVVWSEEFDSGEIDKNVWTYDVGGHGYGNGQLEYNTARRENSYIENGSLVIEARRENYFDNSFTSARMMTQGRFAFKYGTLEARIKFPDVGNGLWPAFWMLGNNFPGVTWPECGETDIVEIGSKAGIDEGVQNKKINAAIHYDTVDDGTFDPDTYDFDAAWIDATVDLNLDYHRYKLEWTPTQLTASLDDVPFWSFDISADYLREFHQPFFPILNIAIGSWPTGYTGIYDPAGITAPLPGKMYIDWIRLEDNGFTEIYMGKDSEENGIFGVFTETIPVDNALAYGDDTDPEFYYGPDAAVYLWEDTMIESATPSTPSEGTECWTFDVNAGGWYGMGVFLPNYRNMKNYSDGFLHFDIQTTLTNSMKVGIKSSRGGEFWLPLGDETDEFGFARDGQWHSVTIPLNRYANTDFNTIHQIFMLAADSASASTTLSLDNIYWEPSVARSTPANGNFGVYTETTGNKDAGEFALGVDGNFFVWEHTLNDATQDPYEGSESISLQSAPGLNWFGAAFTPNVKYNLSAFSYPESKLHFAMKTSSSVTFQVGMKSGNMDGVGQKWITFTAGSDPYGFVRDGQWHIVEIPMADITTEVDLFEVAQLFQILGTNGPISNIEIDDIYFTGGGDPLTPGGGNSNIPPSVSITSPVSGTFYNPGDDITITVDATDSDGTITKVEFLEGLNLLGEDMTSPYSFTINNITEGAYTFRAKVTDNEDLARTSSPVTIYVGTPQLSSINVSPSTASVEEGRIKQFTGKGYDQFGLEFPIPSGLLWSVSGGGVIDDNGYFAAVDVGGPYTVTAVDAQNGVLSDTSSVTVFSGGLCTGQPANGEFKWEASGIADNPAITFIPQESGIGDSVLLIYYSTNPSAAFPGYAAEPYVPFTISGVSQGDIVYFYFTYNTPGGQHSTYNSKHVFQVGNCPAIVDSDFDNSGRVDMADFARLATYWMFANCDTSNNFCEDTDYAEDGDVDFYDLDLLCFSWLKEGGSASGSGISPQVTITSPSDGRIFALNTSITIEADASDADGTIDRVEFYEGSNYLGQDTTSPYSFVWSDAASSPEGQYSLVAVAFDNDGLSKSAIPVTIHIEDITPAELVTNGDFETGDLTGWVSALIGDGSTVIVESGSAHTGQYAAKCVTDWQGNAGVKSEILQTLTDLSGNTAYTFELWVKGQMGVGGVAWAEIKWLNTDGGLISSTGLINLFGGLSNTAYSKKGGTFNAPGGTVSALISIRLEGGALAALNTLYIDDVYLSN